MRFALRHKGGIAPLHAGYRGNILVGKKQKVTMVTCMQKCMVHLYLCLPDRCGQKINKSKGDRPC